MVLLSAGVIEERQLDAATAPPQRCTINYGQNALTLDQPGSETPLHLG